MKSLSLISSLIILLFVSVFQSSFAQRVELRVNAYENVNWSATQHFKANFHTHTHVSDGDLTPHQTVDLYHQAGYHILAITDHIPSWDGNNPDNIVTWPWTNFSGLTQAVRHNATWQDRNPEELGMLAVAGSEFSEGHHRGSFFSMASDPASDYDASFQLVADSGGLAMWYHPGQYWSVHNTYSPGQRFSPEWYVDYHRRFDVLVGMEVYNQGNKHREDRILWDEVLSRSMPDLPVWGYSNDDMHFRNQLFRNYQFMLMESLTEEELRSAMRKGQLFFSFETAGTGEALAPRVDSITVDKKAEYITIYASGYDSIEWISGVSGEGSNRQSRVVSDGKTFGWKEFYEPYVRAVLVNSNGRTYTQPFGFSVRTLHVSEKGSDDNDGLAWESAFASLDRALEVALDRDMIWVARGTYSPRRDPHGNPDPADPRGRSFQLQKSLAIYGGFAGYETDPGQRDILNNETILSGALEDGTQAYHVVFSQARDENPDSAGYHVTLDGFSVAYGMADSSFPHNSGGGVFVASGKLSLQNLMFYNNYAEKGGAVHVAEKGQVVVNNALFLGNEAEKGGAVYSHDGSLEITDSRFADNHAQLGGVMYNEESRPIIRNSIFIKNTAGKGGFQYNENSNPHMLHLSISGNTAEHGGTLFYNTQASNPVVKNSILWGNDSSLPLVLNDSQSEIIFRYSIVQNSGGSTDWNIEAGTDGGANLDKDPYFRGMDDHPLMIYGVSPAVNAGNSSYMIGSKDIRGLPRPADASGPDMGAYEFQPGKDIFSMLPIYVHSASGSDNNSGMSWDSPFESLEKALQSAGPNDTIWVASGTYHPTLRVAGNGERYRAFQMKNHVAIFGGFAGYEKKLQDRDFVNNKTTLSGEIGRREHVYNVFYHDETLQLDSTAVLDGFIITGGVADGSQPRNSGGGMLNIGSSPTIRNTTFFENSADVGGGMFNDNGSSPLLYGTAFIGNDAANGAGMYNRENSNPVIVNASFVANDAGNEGGAVFNNQSSPLLVNVLMSGNAAFEGGALANYLNSKPVIINSTISGNMAFVRGGGIFNSWEAHPIVKNSIIWGNVAGGRENPGSQIANDARSHSTLEYSLYSDDETDILVGGGFFVDDESLIADPLFMEPVDAIEAPVVGGKLLLHSESPAIDAGNNAAIPSFAMTDLNGRPRISDGNGDGSGIIDLGAFEYEAAAKTTRSGDQEEEMIPLGFQLLQNYPNPFNPVTLISFHLPVESHVTLDIMDILGRRVAVLVDEQMPAGEHSTAFDASNLSSGIYLYRIHTNDFVQTRKMLLLK